jgi:hypothetical protein
VSVLRFFFAERFNRFDVAVIVICAITYADNLVGFFLMMAMLFAGFVLSSIGQFALSNREQPQ